MTENLFEKKQSTKGHLTVEFAGNEADKGQVPIGDLLISLGGWNDFIELAASIFARRKLDAESLPLDKLPTITVSAIRRGSFDIDLLLGATDFFESAGASWAGTVLATATVGGVALFLKWMKTLYSRYLEAKTHPFSRDQCVQALQAMAQGLEVTPANGEQEAADLLEVLDKVLKAAAYPVHQSVESITLTSMDAKDFKLEVQYREKETITSGYVPKESLPGDSFHASVVLTELNLKTKHAIANVVSSGDFAFNGQLACRVSDDSLKSPHNPYSKSLDSQQPMTVYVAPSKRQSGPKWIVSRNASSLRTPLLDGVQALTSDGNLLNAKDVKQLPPPPPDKPDQSKT